MFGSSNAFGQSSNSSLSLFGSQTQYVFGQTNNASSNPFAPKPFGAQTGSSTGVFGPPQAFSSFGASSQTFGSSTLAFGGFGHNKSFGFSMPQSTTFGSTIQQSQSAFGNNAFSASSTPAFGNNAFGSGGASGIPTFGPSSTPSFSFGSGSALSTPTFGASSTPSFSFGSGGASSTPTFGASSTPSFSFGSGGASSTPTFGASSTPSFSFGSGGASTPTFGPSSTPSFRFGSSPAFGQSTSAFGSTSFDSTQPPFGALGAQASTPTLGGQQVGSRVIPYAPTTEGGGNQPGGKLVSLSAKDVYKNKTHEELRWEDYQRGDKGGKLPTGQSPRPTSSTTTSFFGPSPGFATTTTPPFGSSSIPGFSSSPSIFASTPAFSIGWNFSNSQSSPLFSSNPSSGQTNSGSKFGQTSFVFGQNTNPAFAQTNNISIPSPGSGTLFSSSSSLTSSNSPPFGQTPGGFGFNNFGQTQIANPTGLTCAMETFNQSNFEQVPASANSLVMQQPIPVTNPFGTVPQGGKSTWIQYGISSIPVVDKPSPVRISQPLLTSQRRVWTTKLPARKYRPGDDGPKVPFFQ
ncbi:unnamed protein product [Arabis nemorensis]|uniref:Nuclear pore complex protein NUP98A n=1 Tax=Arabis nemorensis TaxID=586526 RepID=A0A565CNL9_9BRAS|nr:unnamed protein product [Arabis nemorensis]